MADDPFRVEYAKSNRSYCRTCKGTIAKDALRLARMVQSSFFDGKMALWSHYHCFFKRNRPTCTSEIQGFDRLRWDDQQKIRHNIGGGSGSTAKTVGAANGGSDEPDSRTGKRRKGKPPKGVQKKFKPNDSEEETSLREQSEFVWKIRDKLQENVTVAGLKEMMECNDQRYHKGGESTLLAYVSDGMAFGALEPCPECKGQLRFLNDTEGYQCTGNLTEWTKCLYATKDPKRKPWVIPDDMDDINFLKTFKFKPRKRLFASSDDATAPQPMVVTSSIEAKPAAKVHGSGKPLDDFKIAIIGRLSRTKAKLTEEIEANGGSVVDKVKSGLTVCISSEVEVKKMSKKMQDAKKADIPVVSIDFLEDAEKGAAQLKIPAHNIATWGLKRSTGTDIVDGPKKSAMQVEVKKVKMTVKGGAAVESDSGLEGRCHVLQHQGNLYNATLGMVDITRGTNSFYKLQVLESDKGKRYYLYRSWGRVGTEIGGNKVEQMGKGECIDRFEQLYAEKSGNYWTDRKSFVKRPGRFFPIELDYGEEDEKVKTAVASGSSTKLPAPVQHLIKMIFDIEAMKKALVEFEIDLKKMPLGKLSRGQIKKAFEVLTELQQTVQRDPTSARILDASNRFFTLIPHDFGLARPPLLNTEEIIKSKTEMLENLLDIEVAYSLLKSGDGDGAKDPIDENYEKLKTDMEVLDKDGDEFKMLVEYVANTHAVTHDMYTLEVMEIFKLKRHGEADRYKPFKKLDNRMLLWHGSRTSNFAGILSQGLRIAPPEAPVTGYMFGKGVYFADMVTKSANYCHTSNSDPVGLMLLCEVALGNMYERTRAEYVTELPAGKHSTKGVGQTQPNPAGLQKLDSGVTVPMGKGVASGVSSSLLYNEYIVYDVSHIQMEYLFQMKFKFKSAWLYM